MNSVEPSFSLLLFLATVAAVLVVAEVAVANASTLTGRTRAMVGTAFVAVWLLVPAMLASGSSALLMSRVAFDRYVPSPAPPLVLIAVLTIGNVGLMLSPVGRALCQSAALTWLVGFQVFRIPVELWLHRGFEEGFVPVQMTFAGRNFDVVSGITALLLGIWIAVGRPPRWVLFAWNILGLALLANIVIIALLSAPTSFRVFTNAPANILPSTFPYVWLPSFLVQAALAGHILMFRRLLGRSR